MSELHTLETFEREDFSGMVVAVCSCSNPDGNGEGAVEFREPDAVDAYNAWKDHADAANGLRPVAG